MKRFGKLLSIILASAVTLTTLAGCGAKNEEKVPTDSGEGTTKEESVTESKFSGDLVYVSMWNESEPQATAIKSAVEKFKADNPKVNVEVQWVGRSNSTTVPVSIQAGQQVDVFDNGMYASSPDLFEDISDLLEAPAYGMDGKTVKDSIPQSLWMADKEASELAGLKGRYGIPVSPFVVTFFYNKELFDKAGITVAPKTWDELLAVCQKLVDNNIVPMTTDDAYLNLTYSYYLSKLIGKEAILNLTKDSKDPLWQDPAIKQTLEAMEELSTKKFLSSNVKTNKYPAGQQEFALGEAAMYLNASWFPGEIAATAGPDFQYGAFPFPTVAGGVQDASTNTVGCIPLCVSSKSTNKDAAKELIRYMVGQEFQKELSDLGFAPCTIDTPWPKELVEQGPVVNETKELLPFGSGFASDFINGSVAPEFNKVMSGTTTAAEAYKVIMSKVGK